MKKPHLIRTRLLAAPFILWFGVTSSGPLQFSVCPMHERHAASGSGMTHGEHHAHHAASNRGSPTTPQHQSAQQCTCPSECGGSGGGATGIPASGPIELVQLATIVAAPAAWQATAIAPSRVGFLTPFANGPPDSLPI